jgi:hypothetical protein
MPPINNNNTQIRAGANQHTQLNQHPPDTLDTLDTLDTPNNKKPTTFSQLLAKNHPKMAAKLGCITLECIDHGLSIPHNLRPCLRRAHTTLSIVKVAKSPFDLTKHLSKFGQILTNPQAAENPLQQHRELLRQTASLSKTVEDCFKLLTKTNLIHPPESVGQMITRVRATAMLVTFGWALGDQLSSTNRPRSTVLPPRLLNTCVALGHIMIATLLLNQLAKGPNGQEKGLPWLSAATLMCDLMRLYQLHRKEQSAHQLPETT